MTSDKDEEQGVKGAPRDVLAAVHLRPALGPLSLETGVQEGMQTGSSASWELLISLPGSRSEVSAPDEGLEQDMGLAISHELSR